MNTLSSLIENLSRYYISSNCEHDSDYIPSRTELVYNQKRFSAGCIYIGHAADFSFLQNGAIFEVGTVILLADVSSPDKLPTFPNGVKFAAFSCNQAILFNSFSLMMADVNFSTNTFAKTLDKLISSRYQTSQEINRDFSSLPFPIGKFVRFAIICKENTDSVFSVENLATEVQALFPNNNIAVWEERVVVLFGHNERSFEPFNKYDAKLTDFLKQNDSFMMYSNATRDISTLKSIFELTNKTLILAVKLNSIPNARIFYYEDYCNYCILDMAIQTYLTNNPNGDLLHLVHPAAVALTRYDRRYRTNLRDVLYQYLVNDRNLVKTAEKTFLHRNTVINKMNKIKQIIELDLDDAKFRQRMTFSIQFIKYYEDILSLHVRD